MNSDAVAVAVADALKATKLIFITPQDGVLYNGQIIRQMLVAELQKLLQQNAAGFPELCRAILRWLLAGGCAAVHVSGRVDEGVLAEVFRTKASALWFTRNEYSRLARFEESVRHHDADEELGCDWNWSETGLVII